MSDVRERLEQKLQQIEFEKRIQTGNILSHEDVAVIFSVLKESDQEVMPLVESLEDFCQNLLHTEYLLVEDHLKSILKYYNIISGSDILKSRHQFFFTEERKLTKKPYFSPEKLETVKTTLHENNIFRKMGLENEI